MKEEKRHDYLIIGAGPAGLQLGYFFEKAGRDYLILERADSAGAFFRKFPRHRTLISINKVHTGYEDPDVNLRFDWNSLICDDEKLLFKNYSESYFPHADALVSYLADFAGHYNLNIRYNTDVVRVAREDGVFHLQDAEGLVHTANRLVVATGLFKPYTAPIEGIELAETYNDMELEKSAYANQRVLVIGKGNSGFETADHLIESTALIHVADPWPLMMAWKTHFVGHLRAINNNFLDTYQLKSQNAVLDCVIERIIQRDDGRYVVSVSYTHAEDEQEDLVYDRVLACTGFRFDDSIFDESVRPELTLMDKFPDQTSEWESTNVEGLFFAGTLTQMRDFKKTTSGFIHGFRYNAEALSRIFAKKYHGEELEHEPVEATPAALAKKILERINKSSALWQQFGFLGDLVVMPEGGGEARYYEELPVAYIHDNELGQNTDYYVITLEFGKIDGDPFNIPRAPRPDAAERSTFLHPVVRRYSGDELVAEHHVLENLYGEWFDEKLHEGPLLEYLQDQEGASVAVAA